MGSNGKSEEFTAPRTPGEMLTAHLLAMLKGWSAYGYELGRRLEEEGLGNYNSGTIYRSLRQMEKMGFVSSLWDTTADGPARRIYTLTDAGNVFLQNWIQMLESHRAMLDAFMQTVQPRKGASEVHDGDDPPAANEGASDE